MLTSTTLTLILVESTKVLSNHSFAARASSSVLNPTNPNRREVPSVLWATLTSVSVPAGAPFCSKCCWRRAGVTYAGKFLTMRRDMARAQTKSSMTRVGKREAVSAWEIYRALLCSDPPLIQLIRTSVNYHVLRFRSE